MKQLLEDKRIRLLVIAVLAVVLLLGLLSLVSTVFQLIVPLALVAAGAFAFYKIVLVGRDKPEAVEDEIAESAGVAADDILSTDKDEDDALAQEEEEFEALQRLTALDQAQSEFLDKTSPAEEILEQIKSRKQRLQGDDDE